MNINQEFDLSENRLNELLNRILNCMDKDVLYILNESNVEYNRFGLFSKVEIRYIKNIDEIENNSFLMIVADDFLGVKEVEKYSDLDVLVYTMNFSGEKIGLSSPIYLYPEREDKKAVFLLGKTFDSEKFIVPDQEFNVLAIIHCFNEEDIIERTIKHLISQEIDIYIIDNWSDDNTFEIVKEMQKKYPGKIYVERFPNEGKTNDFELYNQLERTEKISKLLDYKWYIHYDSDEIRISSWKEKTLKQTIFVADRLGYNLIDTTVIDFRITNEDNPDIFMQDGYFSFGHRKAHFEQIKTWKKTNAIDLKSTGGHKVRVPNPKVFPIKILNKHYPFRNKEQAEKKIFKDRVPRFAKESMQRGWHGQYKGVSKIEDFFYDPKNLILWDKETYNKYYLSLFFGIGIFKEFQGNDKKYPVIDDLKSKRVVIFGAGKCGQAIYKRYSDVSKIVMWVDSDFKFKENIFCEKIYSPTKISETLYDFVLIAIENHDTFEKIEEYLKNLNVPKKNIVWACKEEK